MTLWHVESLVTNLGSIPCPFQVGAKDSINDKYEKRRAMARSYESVASVTYMKASRTSLCSQKSAY